MDAQPIIALRNVTKRFGGMAAVANISFSVAPGRVVALLGPSGCGKTTTLRIIAGFVEPDDGVVLIGGHDMRGVRPYERNIGLVFQDYALFPHLTVAQNVAYGMRQRRVPRAEIPDRTAAMLRLVRLESFEARRPESLSGGQQQRVALARALATNPSVVLLDEPLSALDAKLRQELRSELKEILSIAGATTIVVTHDQEEAMSLAEHVIVMANGEILQQADPSTIYRAPVSKSVATFIGRSNWFEGVVGRAIDGGLCEFQCAEGTLIVSAPEKNGAACGLSIRPERLVLISGDDPAATTNRLEGKIADVVHLGGEIHVSVTLASGHRVLIVQQDRGHTLPTRGDEVLLSFRPADGCVVPV